MRTLESIVDVFSGSKLELWEQCPEKFRGRYVDGIKNPPGASQALGNAVDATANATYFQKLQTRRTLPAADVQARFADWWDREAAKVPDLAPAQRGELLDVGVRGVGHWRDQVAQHVQPLVEPQVRIELELEDTLPGLELYGIARRFRVVGFFDLIAEVPMPGRPELLERAIVDHKASGKTWHERELLRSAQPPIYTRGTGVPVFQFHVLRTDLVKPKTPVIRQHVPDSAFDHVARRMCLARRGIAHAYRSGDWSPHRNHALCSRRWCGHWHGCERRHGGTVPA